MYTPIQTARKANIHVNTVRKWSADYAEFLSQTRSDAGTRLFSDEDVDTLRTIAALRRTGMLPETVKERLATNSTPPVVEVNTPFSPHFHPIFTPHEADIQPTTGYIALQRQIDALARELARVEAQQRERVSLAVTAFVLGFALALLVVAIVGR